jgi:hypothetical protein
MQLRNVNEAIQYFRADSIFVEFHSIGQRAIHEPILFEFWVFLRGVNEPEEYAIFQVAFLVEH